MAVGLPGILVAFWVWTLKEPLRGESDGQPSPVVRPNAWREFGKELGAILPPLTLLSVARIPGAMKPNLIALALVAVAAILLWKLTGDGAQWIAYGIGVYAVYSWTQSLKHRDPATHRLIWGTPATILLAAAFGSIAFITYAVSFWTPPYVLRTFYTAPTDPALIMTGMTAAKEVSTIIGWSAAIAAAIGVILGGFISDWWRKRHPAGRLFVCAAGVLLPLPGIAWAFTTDDLETFYWLVPYIQMMGSCWVGASVATLAGSGPAADARHRRGDRDPRHVDGRPRARPLCRGNRRQGQRQPRHRDCRALRRPADHIVRPVVGVAADRAARSDPRGARRRRGRLVRQDRAGDPVAAVAARVGLVIVGPGVDHQRRPVGIHDRVGTFAQPRRADREDAFAAAIRADA